GASGPAAFTSWSGVGWRETTTAGARHGVAQPSWLSRRAGILPARFAGWKPVLRLLTPIRVTVTISDEYRARPRGDTFDAKPHTKERKIPQSRDNSARESSRNNRAACIAGWFQDRCRSR